MKIFSSFPSINDLTKTAANTVGRFPMAMLCALVGTAIAVYLVDDIVSGSVEMLDKGLMAAALGLPLFIVLSVWCEKRKFGGIAKYAIQAVGAALLAAYYLSLPTDVREFAAPFVRFLLLGIGLHFAVACLPWIGGDRVTGFWQYNKALFIRFLIAALYSAVLYIGLAIALGSADYLFGVDVKEVRYAQLWIAVAGLFNTWVFLAGIPKDLERLDDAPEYPTGLKIFTQFILLPLVGLYFVILIAYEAKILITWNWPRGWVSELVLWYAVIGILSLLLLHPLRERIGTQWIKTFSKWYYLTLVPLVAMLLLAIFQRISDYGITENRFFALALAIGLTVVMLYFVISKRKDIRIIPIVLCCLAFLSAHGPVSAFSVSRSSQQNRLEALLVKNGMMIEGKLCPPETEPSLDDRREMSSIVRHFCEWQGTEPFTVWLDDSLLSSVDTLSNYQQPEKIAKMIGFTLTARYGGRNSGSFNLQTDKKMPISITGFDHMIEYSVSWEGPKEEIFEVEDDSVTVIFDADKTILTLGFGKDTSDEEVSSDLHLLDTLTAFAGSGHEKPSQLSQLTFDLENRRYDIRVIIESVYGNMEPEELTVRTATFMILLRKTEE